MECVVSQCSEEHLQGLEYAAMLSTLADMLLTLAKQTGEMVHLDQAIEIVESNLAASEGWSID